LAIGDRQSIRIGNRQSGNRRASAIGNRVIGNREHRVIGKSAIAALPELQKLHTPF
jgi:hypothetical protein